MIAIDVHITIERLSAGAYLLRWRCSAVERDGDVLVVDDQASARWWEIADAHVPGAPALIEDLVAAAITAYSRCDAASTASSCS